MRRVRFAPEPLVATEPASLMFQIGEQGNYDSPVRHSQDVALQVFNCGTDRDRAIQKIREWIEDVSRIGFFDPETSTMAKGGAA